MILVLFIVAITLFWMTNTHYRLRSLAKPSPEYVQTKSTVPHKRNTAEKFSFRQLSLKFNTDKVTTHQYDRMYDKYLNSYRNSSVKLLEIGLGCQQPTIGASARVWRSFFGPSAEINFIEYDRACGEAWFQQYGKEVGNCWAQSEKNRLKKQGSMVYALGRS